MTATIVQPAISGETPGTFTYSIDGGTEWIVPANSSFTATFECETLTVEHSTWTSPEEITLTENSVVCVTIQPPFVGSAAIGHGPDVLFLLSLWFWVWLYMRLLP